MNRETPAFEATTATTVRLDGIELLAFHGCGYLGLAHDPRVIDAARDALDAYGPSGLASRATSGNLDVHERLEERLAEFLGLESALVVPDGYLADLAVVAALKGRTNVALLDADSHPSLVDAARMAGLESYDYGPGDMSHAFALLDRFKDASPLVLTDGVFAMHGRLAPAAELLRHLPDGGLLLVDDSHGVGVLGARGRGVMESFGIADERIVLTGSLGKALGSGGGFVAGPRDIIESTRRGSASFTGTTALSPPLAAAALAALDVIDAEPERLERLRANTGQLHRTARRAGIRSSGTFLPILRIELAKEEDAKRLSAALHVAGIYAPAIRYPGLDGEGVVRLAVTSEHTAAEIRRLEETLVEHLPGSASDASS
ncbi:MAG: pyridoxal phosphate-dependent aminotransferase family protein [Planctomycetota bacterium]